MTKRILFACLGNICRSPLAEGILRSKAQAAGLDIVVDSAGTGGWHVGDPPDARAVVAARISGYDIAGQIARSATPEDFDKFDLIAVMDDSNLRDMERLRRNGSATPVVKVTDYAPDSGAQEVPDPYYTGKFMPVIKLLECCADGIVAQLLAERQ